ncbi:MAG: sigma-70 family RNA polymerase sigma factor [Candidatus Omnitrophica bacterium]|nr:sigma-70 family RNA polymerase sigma factor [Candidatus Omnitrophota bacterium]
MKNNFETLINRLSPTIRRISRRLNGHFTFFNDDDLCQEALAHLWILFREDRLSDKTDSYILQGCYFHLKNYIRTSMDRVNFISFENPIDEDGTMLEEIIASDDLSTIDLLEDKALYEEVLKNGLNSREVEIVNMCAEGLTTREIGDRLAISHVAVVKLRKKIREKCERLRK